MRLYWGSLYTSDYLITNIVDNEAILGVLYTSAYLITGIVDNEAILGVPVYY